MNGGVDREINFKAWKSMLIRDGVGPYLSPRRLIEKVQHMMVRNGLTESSDSKQYQEALGYLMDMTEFYMRGFMSKLIKKTRGRL